MPNPANTPTGTLALLLEAEQRLAERLETARVEATRLVEQAEASAERARHELEETLHAARREAQKRLEQQVTGEIADATSRAKRLDEVTSDEIESLAGRLLGGLLREARAETQAKP